jgi:PAS domain-containing protein
MRISLRVRYLLYLGFLHAIIMLLAFKVLSANKLYFIISEVLVLLSLIISVVLYQAIDRPFKLLLMGAEAMRDQDFSIKLRPVGTTELDQLIEVYNQMIEQLRIERLQRPEQHFFLEKLIQASPIAILVLDFDENLLKINPKAQDLFSIVEGQFLHQPLSVLGHPIVNALQKLQDGESKTFRLMDYLLSKFSVLFMDKVFCKTFSDDRRTYFRNFGYRKEGLWQGNQNDGT